MTAVLQREPEPTVITTHDVFMQNSLKCCRAASIGDYLVQFLAIRQLCNHYTIPQNVNNQLQCCKFFAPLSSLGHISYIIKSC